MRLFFHKFSNGNIQTYELGCGTAVSLFDNSYNLYYPTSYEFISIKASKWERRFSKNYFCSEEISLFLLTPPAASDWIMSPPRLIMGQKLLLTKNWFTQFLTRDMVTALSQLCISISSPKSDLFLKCVPVSTSYFSVCQNVTFHCWHPTCSMAFNLKYQNKRNF